MELKIDGIEMMLKKKMALAAFGRPVDDRLVYSRDKSFSSAQGLGEGGMGWVWCHWLQGTPPDEICSVVEPFVNRGMEIQALIPNQRKRGLHDLFLLHCAIFASSDAQLQQLAERVIDAYGIDGHEPDNGGDLYASAWCGMLKYWILGDHEEATKQSQVIWKAYRPPFYRAATKPLVSSWLSGKRESFQKKQEADFEKLWKRANKDGTVTSRRGGRVTVDVARFPIAQLWCWAHCGLALLSYRRDIEVVTDPFWFPSHALKVVDSLK